MLQQLWPKQEASVVSGLAALLNVRSPPLLIINIMGALLSLPLLALPSVGTVSI